MGLNESSLNDQILTLIHSGKYHSPILVYFSCFAIHRYSDSSLNCPVADGLALITKIATSVVVRPGSTSSGFTYFRDITSMESPNGKITSGLSLTLTGTGLGVADYTSRLRIGDSACDASAWISESSATCKVPSSVSRPERMLISLGMHPF